MTARTAGRSPRAIPDLPVGRRAGEPLRRRRTRRHWPICDQTGKQRLGERKDAKLALRAASHIRAQTALHDQQTSWTVHRAYACEFCGGWHLTSQRSWRDRERSDS